MPRWRVAAGSLAPLAAAAVVMVLHGRVIPGSILMLCAVAFGYLFGGLTAGVAALETRARTAWRRRSRPPRSAR